MPRLILSPVLAENLPSLQLVEHLKSLRLIGEHWQQARGERYLIGDAFLSQLSFMGCAPAIELEPPADGSENFLHIEISYHESLRFFAGINMIARCPRCRARLTEWLQHQLLWNEGRIENYQCPKCDADYSPLELDWKKSAGFARDAVIIHGIYPHEALPTESLLQRLEQLTQNRWHYFYAD